MGCELIHIKVCVLFLDNLLFRQLDVELIQTLHSHCLVFYNVQEYFPDKNYIFQGLLPYFGFSD